MADFQQSIYYTYAFDMSLGKFGHEFIYSIQEDKIYKYKSGVWEAMYKEELFKIIQENRPQVTACHPSVKQQVLDHFKTIKHARLEVFNSLDLLNLMNVMVDPTGNNTLAHKPDQYSTIRIPYKYDSLARCELWLKTLDEIMENDKNKINSLQEYFGYCLTRDTKQIMSLLVQGESKSGKSTILHVLRNLVGTENCSSVEMKNISNPQYTPMLINKLINIDSDVSEHAKDFEAEFKKITSGEPINCNQKFVPTFHFTPYCKIVIAANKFPRITDQSSAFYNRLLIIPCNRVFAPNEQDNLLKSKLLEELPGILNWAAIGLRRLNTRGRFEEKEFNREAIDELREESNPVESFFRDHIDIDVSGNGYVIKEDLYDSYAQWCIKNGHGRMGNNKFGQIVYRKYSKYTPKNTMLHAIGKRIWRNIKYVHFKDDTKQDITWEPATISNTSDAKVVNAVQIGTGSQADIDWSA